jgi:hypothetical protein
MGVARGSRPVYLETLPVLGTIEGFDLGIPAAWAASSMQTIVAPHVRGTIHASWLGTGVKMRSKAR